MTPITFEQLPAAFSELFQKVENIERLLQAKQVSQPAEEEIFDVQQSAQFLGLSIATIYTLNSKGELPSMKRSKKLYFLKQDLVSYLKAGRKQTNGEIEASSHNFISRPKSKR